MRSLKLINLIFLLGLCSGIAMAKDLDARVMLKSIKVINPSEAGGDELYFHITQYSSNGTSQESRVPAYPSHWLSSQAPQLKNVVLWRGNISDKESLRLVITLAEQDLAPFNPDDSLGAVQLNIQNTQGKLKQEWVIPVFEEENEVEKLGRPKSNRYVFKGASSRYDVEFVAEQE